VPAPESTEAERQETYRELQRRARSALREPNLDNPASRVDEADRVSARYCPNCGAIEAP
jgi:hypothetical protein